MTSLETLYCLKELRIADLFVVEVLVLEVSGLAQLIHSSVHCFHFLDYRLDHAGQSVHGWRLDGLVGDVARCSFKFCHFSSSNLVRATYL